MNSDPETGSMFGRGPHQFRARNDLIEPQRTRTRSNENAGKSTKPVDILPLITVWLQARVQANHLRYQWLITFAAVRASPQAPEIRRSYYPE
jgi:hypothetical protein